MTTSVDLVLKSMGMIPVDEALEMMRSHGVRRATLLFPGSLTPDQMARWRQLRESRFMLVRNNGSTTGERYACRRHVEQSRRLPPGVSFKAVFHEYFTCMCVNMPWRGLETALYGYATLRSDERLKHKLTEWLPDLAVGHPKTFGHERPQEPGEDIIAVALGALEPISEARARALADKINGRRPPVPFEL